MKINTITNLALMMLLTSTLSIGEVKITENIASITTKHKGEDVTIERIQDQKNRLVNSFSKTSRECPPFCIQPMDIGKVKTIGELEVLTFIQSMKEDNSLILIDTRTREWYRNHTIPGAINLPFSMLKKEGKYIKKILALLGGEKKDDKWSFSSAQTLLIFSNGQWDSQATKAISSLIEIGYPEDKILYYRGGMQTWQILGLTIK